MLVQRIQGAAVDVYVPPLLWGGARHCGKLQPCGAYGDDVISGNRYHCTREKGHDPNHHAAHFLTAGGACVVLARWGRPS